MGKVALAQSLQCASLRFAELREHELKRTRSEPESRRNPRRARTWVATERPTAWETIGGRDLAALASQLPEGTRRVVLCDTLPHDQLVRWATGELPDGWTHDGKRGHYLRPGRSALHYLAPWGSVELIGAATWGMPDGTTPQQARHAVEVLLTLVRRAWRDERLPMLTTPATLGRDLLLRTWPDGAPSGMYAPLPDELATLVATTTTQGRWQRFAAPRGVTHAPNPSLYDMRFGYAGFLSGLGAGGRHVEYPNATHEDFTGDGRLRWQRGWFRVTASVPADWFGIGMLPELVEGHQPGECDRCAGTGRSTAGEGASVACWPDRPGLRFTTWADGAELELAASFGWRFVVHEGIERDEAKPLDVWRKRLLDVRQQLAALVTAGELDARTAKLAAGALRMVVLQTVGALASQGHPITHVVGSVNEVPDGTPFTIQGDAIVWTDHSGGIAWGELSHPEWAAAVWARCRARVLHDRGVWPHTGALAAWTAGQLVAIRQDAVWLADDPHWRPFASCAARPREATTNPEGIGHYRLDAQLGRAVPWPSSTSEIVKWKG